ncbi:MAG: prepilin-type N-terminal cleavage/methylation domain-containing protein [bacterium]|nr:prepilin-type N-terminal cleavage/methylation domain-containing protein [bacterium]
MMKSRLQDDNGFTLVELMIIIAIVGVLSGIAVMSSRDMYASYQLRGVARQIYSDMQYARLLAIKMGKESLIDFGKDGSGNVYYKPKWKADGGKLGKLDMTIYLTGEGARYKNLKVCHPTSPGTAFADAEFNPNGTATTGGIKLSVGERVYKIYVSSPGTGNVRIVNKATLVEDGDNANKCP